MRQLITRIDDGLHARLKDRARAAGTSVNALVVEALERLTVEAEDPRALVRRRARDAGMLAVPPVSDAPPSSIVGAREAVVAATRGAGTAVGEALAAERDGS